MKIKAFALSLAAALSAGTVAQAHEGASAAHFATQPDHGGIAIMVLLGLVAAGIVAIRDILKK